MGGIKFGETEFRATLTAKTAGLDIKDTKEGKAFLLYCEEFKLKPEHLGRETEVDGKRLKLMGFNMKNRKNVCVLKDMDSGSTYKAPAKNVYFWFAEDDMRAAGKPLL